MKNISCGFLCKLLGCTFAVQNDLYRKEKYFIVAKIRNVGMESEIDEYMGD